MIKAEFKIAAIFDPDSVDNVRVTLINTSEDVEYEDTNSPTPLGVKVAFLKEAPPGSGLLQSARTPHRTVHACC